MLLCVSLMPRTNFSAFVFRVLTVLVTVLSALSVASSTIVASPECRVMVTLLGPVTVGVDLAPGSLVVVFSILISLQG
jgi:hypothetical protein